MPKQFTPEERTLSAAYAKACREHYHAKRQMNIKNWCGLCGEPIERFHKWRETEDGKQHKNCKYPMNRK
jgi:hypothetical protein